MDKKYIDRHKKNKENKSQDDNIPPKLLSFRTLDPKDDKNKCPSFFCLEVNVKDTHDFKPFEKDNALKQAFLDCPSSLQIVRIRYESTCYTVAGE